MHYFEIDMLKLRYSSEIKPKAEHQVTLYLVAYLDLERLGIFVYFSRTGKRILD